MFVRNVVSFCLLFFAVVLSPICTVTVEAQQVFQPLNQSRQAYYEPPTRDQYMRHLQTAYQETSSFPGQIPMAQPTIEQRAAAMLQRQYGSKQNVQFSQPNQSFQPTNRIPAAPVRFRQQEDPFGDSQAIPFGPKVQDGAANNQFDPFADPPSETVVPQQPPEQKSFDPFGSNVPAEEPSRVDPVRSPPVQQQPRTMPRQSPDPFADPQGGLQDPVLPGDAQPTPDTNMPQLDDPTAPQGNLDPRAEDYPSGAILPNDSRPKNPTPKDPFIDPVPDDSAATQVDPTSTYRSPAGVYRPPGQRGMSSQSQSVLPPIVQPGQVSPYEMQLTAPQYSDPNAGGYQSYDPAQMAPAYQAPYQPMPYTQPRSYGPPAAAYGQQPAYSNPSAMPPTAIAPAPVAATPRPSGSVYQGVIPYDSGPQDPRAQVSSQCGGSCATGNCSSCANGNASGCPDFYLSLFGGLADIDLTSLTTGRDYFADDGIAFGAALGRRNGRNLRSEIEFAARNNDISALTGGFLGPLEGDLKSYSGMANAYWEFIDVPSRCFKPYVGVGIGFVSIDSTLAASGNNRIAAGSENDTSLAYQLMAGVNYKAYRNMDLFAEYRVFEAESYRIETLSNSGKYEYQVDNILFGLRWKF